MATFLSTIGKMFSSIPGSGEPSVNNMTSEDKKKFLEAYECSKLNNDWHKVSAAIKAHPEWLTIVPPGRRWTMLHQIVFSVDVKHLKEVLGFQLTNPNFRLLFKAADERTVFDVAQERANVNPEMSQYIQELIDVEAILDNAKESKWAAVKSIAEQKPNRVNKKPPYKKYYLIHQLAEMNEMEAFKTISDICHFELDVKTADGKTAAQVARENNHEDFAQYIEDIQAVESNSTSGGTASGATASGVTTTTITGQKKYSPNFYDDISISIIPPNFNFAAWQNSLTSGHSTSAHHHHQPMHHTSHSYFHSSAAAAEAPSPSTQKKKGSHGPPKAASDVPKVTEEEQLEYETKLTKNAANLTSSNILASVTCPITKAVFRDPVMASDGYTYEREAIEKWLQSSTRSPMTNIELPDGELRPNFNIRSLLKILQDAEDPSAKGKP